MSEAEKNVIGRFSDIFPKLSEKNQSYVLGIAEGMAMVRDNEKDKPSKEVQCV